MIMRTYTMGATAVYGWQASHDALGRPVSTADSESAARTWTYNTRSEMTGCTSSDGSYSYFYDSIGNRTSSSSTSSNLVSVTHSYTANGLNQYDCVDSTALTYDADGNLTGDGRYSYAYDCENRLVSVTPLSPSAGDLAIRNAYDHRSRRVQKTVLTYDGADWLFNRRHTFVWDGWNIVLERIDYADSDVRFIEYYWGNDLSGTEQGAGGVGGLLAVSCDGTFYVPFYDSSGNIMGYVDEFGTVVARYAYDPFGNVVTSLGGTASPAAYHPSDLDFYFGFSTKYHDREVGLVAYQLRSYSPRLGRWLNRDPIEEAGGVNLYGFCQNNALWGYDTLGLEWILERNASKRWAIARRSSRRDTVKALADKLKLDFNERAKWLKRNKDNPCLFEVPNVFCVYTSKSGWGDGVITFVTQLKRKAMSDADLYRDRGFMVISHKWASSEDAFYDMWTQDGIYAISFAGHGSRSGFVADKTSGSAIDPLSVHPPYHLSAIRAYSCLSSSDIPGNSILPDGTIPFGSWKNHVSQRGTFFGYSGLVNWLSQFWLEESTNAE